MFAFSFARDDHALKNLVWTTFKIAMELTQLSTQPHGFLDRHAGPFYSLWTSHSREDSFTEDTWLYQALSYLRFDRTVSLKETGPLTFNIM